MSISELSMIVNDNFDVPLNQQIRNNRFLPARIITQTTDWVVERSGWYKIICVGAGGHSDFNDDYGEPYYSGTGGSGGVAIKTKHFVSGETVLVEINGADCNCEGISAGGGGDADVNEDPYHGGTGGIATGGDENYPGNAGKYGRMDTPYPQMLRVEDSVPVSVYIPELSFVNEKYKIEDADFLFRSEKRTRTLAMSLLGFGIGQGVWVYESNNESGKIPADSDFKDTAACIIIPLEYTE